MREDQQQPVDIANFNPADVVVTDPLGNPLPADHPMVQNPQVGRPFSKGDLTLPENQPQDEQPAPQPMPQPQPVVAARAPAPAHSPLPQQQPVAAPVQATAQPQPITQPQAATANEPQGNV